MPPKCTCGSCAVCKAREKMRQERRDNAEHVRALDRARYRRDKAKRLAAMKEYAKRNPERVQAAKRRWVERNPEKRRAQVALNNAVRDGRITKGLCEQRKDGGCSGRIEAHHDDYGKPLEVRWLCLLHHAQERRRNDD